MRSKPQTDWLFIVLLGYVLSPAIVAVLSGVFMGGVYVADTVGPLLTSATPAEAAAVSISFTAGQNTYTQNTLIPEENARRCAAYSRTHPGSGCVTADLTAPNGTCVAAPFTAVNLDNMTYRDCTIYTLDAAGEALYDSDQLYLHQIQRVSDDLAADVAATKTAWAAANQTARNSACTAISRPSGCHFF